MIDTSRVARMCSMTVPSRNGGPFSASAAPRITPTIRSTASRAVSASRSSHCSMRWLRSVVLERVVHAVVVPLGDTVLAVIAAQLREEGDGLLGALGDELAEQPGQRRGERDALLGHVGWEEVGGRGVDGEPAGVEPADQFLRAGVGVDRGAQ